ncbi:MAG: EamA family transporter [Candidatus Dojkabacteria bacterium]|nr:EamA family transporter [Candidatus Dojkabacteria bacterium]MDQ7020665.1 EamA family transporter [Candidatus Dojkabacteria bacterium]
MWLSFALLSALSASFVSVFAKLGLKDIDSSLATLLRSIVMAVFLAGFIFITGKFNFDEVKNIGAKDWLLIALSGVAGATSWLFYFYALKNSENRTSQIAAIDKLSLVFVLIFTILILKESVNIKIISGIILMAAGAVLTVL